MMTTSSETPPIQKSCFKALIPLKKKWIGQASLSGLRRWRISNSWRKVDVSASSSVLNPSPKQTLIRSQKYQNDPAEYREIIDVLHRFGITIWGSFIFGFDEDDPSIFEETVAFAIRAKLFSVVFAILTPYPETSFYQRVKKEGRLVQDRWWLLERPEESAPYFIPKKMSGEVLRECWKKSWKEFLFPFLHTEAVPFNYPPTLINRWVYFPFQLMQRRFTQKKIIEGRRRYRARLF